MGEGDGTAYFAGNFRYVCHSVPSGAWAPTGAVRKKGTGCRMLRMTIRVRLEVHRRMSRETGPHRLRVAKARNSLISSP